MGVGKPAIGLVLFLSILFVWQGSGVPQVLRPDQYSGRFGDLTDIYLNDNSDWWSEIPKIVAEEPPGGYLAIQADPRNFRILGISVWGYTVSWPQQIVHTLGRATVIERGDAGTGRAQVCYQSAENSGQTKLIFETGECSESLYLFEDGAPFVGSDRCVSSPLVNEHLRTPMGLGLALTPAEVTKILGPPSAARRDFVVYKYTAKMTRTKKQLKDAERVDPGSGAPDLVYDDTLFLVIRLRNGRAWFLFLNSQTC